MKKIWIVVIVAVALIAVAGTAIGAVLLFRSFRNGPVAMMRQTRGSYEVQPGRGFDNGFEFGPGMMERAGRGMMGGRGSDDQRGFERGFAVGGASFDMSELHTRMVTALAQKLGMTVDEMNKSFDSGKSLLDIAADKNMTVADLLKLETEVRTQVIDQALKDNIITQAQADFMKQADGHMGFGFGFGMGMHGFWGGKGVTPNTQPQTVPPAAQPTVAPTQQ